MMTSVSVNGKYICGGNGMGMMIGYKPTLQCTNQLSVDLRTVPRIPIRQCCFVRVSNEVVGGSVFEMKEP